MAAGLVVWFQFDPESAKFAAYLLGGLLLLWQVSASSQRATAAEKMASAAEKGNIAERFKNAIEHLGHDSASIRLGGIYALHHIAWETEEYRGWVIQIMCAHIRGTTTSIGYKPREETISAERYLLQYKKPSIEIESILVVLFNKVYHQIYKELFANLESANLQGANFAHTDLERTSFFSADLQYALFSNANLRDAIFFNTNLQGADLTNAKNLTVKQLLQAKTLYKAKLPDGMEQELKKQKPKLFEEPHE